MEGHKYTFAQNMPLKAIMAKSLVYYIGSETLKFKSHTIIPFNS